MNYRLQIFSQQDTIGLLVAEGNLDQLPAVSWALDAALENVWRACDARSPIGRALNRFSDVMLGPDQRFGCTISARRDLVRKGQLIPEGAGWSASLRVDGDWKDSYSGTLRSLPRQDRRALALGAQRVVAIRSMLSKKGAALLSERSGTI